MPNKSSAPWTVLAGRGGGVAAVAVAALLASSLSGPSTTQASPATQPQGLNAAPDRISAPDVVPAKVSAGKRARNVIFIQGDGMGIAHRELIRLALKGQGGELTMNKMQYTGLVHTESADKKEAVTDSAAAATAYATGVRSYNGAIGVDSDGKPVTSLLERARAAGKSTGVVTTSQVTDASPGAFSAHVANRSDQSEIARQIIEQTRVDVVLGGGEDWWYPAGNPGCMARQSAEGSDRTEQGYQGEPGRPGSATRLQVRAQRCGTEEGEPRQGAGIVRQ